jgi:hypothetical protein
MPWSNPVCGWRIAASNAIRGQSVELTKSTLQMHLGDVANQLPEAVCDVIRAAPITLSETACHSLMAYHWASQSIEVLTTRCVVQRLQDPRAWHGFFIHEFGHVFHQHFLYGRPENAELEALLDEAVLNVHYTHSFNPYEGLGEYGTHYALLQPDDDRRRKEYFACLFCAYFGASDWTPATRKQLQEQDPSGLEFIQRLISACVAEAAENPIAPQRQHAVEVRSHAVS